MKQGARVGPYELLAPLGAGGMGEVWKARDTRLDRTVAIKFSKAAFSDRFQHEARAIAALNHPNIATLYDVGPDYLVMEYVEGVPIQPTDDMRKLLDLGAQIADGLAAAHSAGFIHRDLKPDNILVTKQGRVKILDFGLAKHTAKPAQDEATFTVTQPGTVMGTIAYMSPEQVRGHEVDHRSDIFSFGLILHELLAGKRAFQRDTAVETMNAILKEDAPELPPGVPCGIRPVIAHALEKEPERRFQSAQDFGFALRLSGTTSSAATVIREDAGTTRRTWLAAGLGAAGAVLAGAAGYWLGTLRGARSDPSFRKLTFRDGMIGAARFTANGGVVFAATWFDGPVRLHHLAAGETAAHELGIGGPVTLASISSKNELAVILLRNQMLARAPLSGGAPRELLAGVIWADWAPDGESMAVALQANGKNTIQYPIGNTLSEFRFLPYSLRVSPAGDLVAYTGSSSSGFRGSGFKVAVLDRSGKETVLATYTTQGHNFSSVFWTPDGRELWFESPLLSEPGTIYAVDLKGRQRVAAKLPGAFVPQSISTEGRVLLLGHRYRDGLRALVPGGTELDLTWGERTSYVELSPDGAFCVFLTHEPDQVSYLRRLDGSPAVRLGPGSPVSISPDGKWVQLFRTGGDAPSVLVPTGPGQEKPFLIDQFEARTAGIVAWLPEENYLLSGRQEGKPRRLYLWNAHSRELRPVGPEASHQLYSAIVDPLGNKCAAQFDREWMVFAIQGGQPKPVPLTPTQTVAGFTEDGRGLWIVSAPPGGFAPGGAPVSRLDLSTGQMKEAFRLETPPGAFVDLFQVRIAPSGKAYVYIHRTHSSELYLAEGLR
jgi:predicted Ser/Thr protein kinase